MAVEDVQLLLIDLRLIELHRALVLLHDVDLILVLLPRDRILLGQLLIAHQIDLCLGEQALVMRKLTLELGLLQLVGPGVDLRQEVALIDKLAFGEADFHQLAVDLCLHGNGRDRRDGAERIYDDANVALSDGRGTDRLSCGKLTARRGRRLARINPSQQPVGANNERDQNDETDDNTNWSAARTFNDRRGRRRANGGGGGHRAKLKPRLIIRSARSLVHIRFRASECGSL